MTYIRVNCEMCGKPIELEEYNAGEYIYKRKTRRKTIYFCGYNCRTKWERRKK